ncbi:transposase [Streptomyces sp. 351MFTsu5.1]|uniref:transposase n=1 Tax=Streptomyces sp. 351MFTsu5.1 TaxID=1172180 RepID=UPI0009970451
MGTDARPSAVGRRKAGSKHHLICDGRGTPLTVITTAANVNDVTQTLALVEGHPARRRKARPPAQTPRLAPRRQGIRRLEGRAP